jgi:hypothetical protein
VQARHLDRERRLRLVRGGTFCSHGYANHR